jgi:hypothetical protein
MLERLKDLPAGIDGLCASGTLSAEDYERVMVPVLEDARREGRRVRLLYQFAPEFSGFTPGAAWEDARVGLRYLRLFDGCAIVGDIAWIRDASRLAGLFMPCPVRTFPNSERASAVAWLESLAHRTGLSFRLLPEFGVLVIEVTSALRREDFDALSVVVDGWIEAHGELRGVAVHAPEFPGWQNLGGFMSHLRFVRDHHREVRRVAIAVGGELAEIAPRIVEHFVQAEVKHFDYAAFDEAIAWAGAPTAR